MRKSCTVKLHAWKLNLTFMQPNIKVYSVSFNLIGHLNVEVTCSSLKIQVKEEVFLEFCLIDRIGLTDSDTLPQTWQIIDDDAALSIEDIYSAK